jgi:hypothetical protein
MRITNLCMPQLAAAFTVFRWTVPERVLLVSSVLAWS